MYIRTYVRMYVRTYVRTCVRAYVCRNVRWTRPSHVPTQRRWFVHKPSTTKKILVGRSRTLKNKSGVRPKYFSSTPCARKVPTYFMYYRMSVCTYVCTYARTYVRTYVRTCVRTYVRTYVPMFSMLNDAFVYVKRHLFLYVKRRLFYVRTYILSS